MTNVDLKTPENLSAEERVRVDEVVKLLRPHGVLVNVCLGRHPWDVRPLYLDRGIVRIYRFSQPLSAQLGSDLSASLSAAESLGVVDQTHGITPDGTRVWVKREYYQRTLLDEVRTGAFADTQQARSLIGQLIAKVAELHRLGQVHGHIWVGNLVAMNGDLRILDPLIGTFPRPPYREIPDAAPETATGGLDLATDVYGVASVVIQLLGASLSSADRIEVERILTQPPGKRPDLSFFDRFGSAVSTKGTPADPVITGRLLGGKASLAVPRAPESIAESSASVSSLRPPAPDPTLPPSSKIAPRHVGIGIGVMAALLFGVKYQYPAIYYRIARVVPSVRYATDPLLEGDWQSGDRGRILEVARQALFDRRPAAENAIVSAALAGAQIPTVYSNVLRIAFDERWSDDLGESDRTTALALALQKVLPEGLSTLPPLESLHPAVILASLAHADYVAPPGRAKAVSTDQLASLPSPLGEVFEALNRIGLRDLGSPAGIAVCHLATGDVTPNVVEAYFSGVSELPQLFQRLAALLPLIRESKELGDAVATSLKVGGGPVGRALAWFDEEDVSRWSNTPAVVRLSLILGQLPQTPLGLEQFADLLLFPLPALRTEAMKVLVRQFLTDKSVPMLTVIVSDQGKLSRTQVVSLVSALNVRTDAGPSFISLWFQTNPAPTAVARLLAARGAFEVPDVFNLEAARYLRKASWDVSFEELKLLAAHPEPLARSLAYGRLSTEIGPEELLLRERLGVETDPGLKKLLEERLGSSRENVA